MLPVHNEVGEAVALTADGTVLIVTAEVVASVLPQALVAVSVYTPAESVVTETEAGLRVELKLLGPDQENDVAFIALPVKVSTAPLHTLVTAGTALTAEGVLLTVIMIVSVAVPQGEVAV